MPGTPLTLKATLCSRRKDLYPVLGAYCCCGISCQLIGTDRGREAVVAVWVPHAIVREAWAVPGLSVASPSSEVPLTYGRIGYYVDQKYIVDLYIPSYEKVQTEDLMKNDDRSDLWLREYDEVQTMHQDPRKHSTASAAPTAGDPCMAFPKPVDGPFPQRQLGCCLPLDLLSGRKGKGVQADPRIGINIHRRWEVSHGQRACPRVKYKIQGDNTGWCGLLSKGRR